MKQSGSANCCQTTSTVEGLGRLGAQARHLLPTLHDTPTPGGEKPGQRGKLYGHQALQAQHRQQLGDLPDSVRHGVNMGHFSPSPPQWSLIQGGLTALLLATRRLAAMGA